MKFVVAVHGAVGVELLRRGHEVRMAASPNMLGNNRSGRLGSNGSKSAWLGASRAQFGDC
jgi:hypothetical protein